MGQSATEEEAVEALPGCLRGHPVVRRGGIPWDCRRLVVGTGADGALPVMEEVKQEAARREVALLAVPTREAIRALEAEPKNSNAILHVTC